ncbi:MAG: glycosyltransferase family 9 protein [Bacillota bacterium]
MKRILLVRLSAIGDVIHALPIARAVRNHYPEAYVTWIVEKKAYNLVEMNPYLDRVILLPKASWKREFKTDKWGTIKKARRFFKKISRQGFELALDVHGLFKSAFSARMCGANVIYGPRDGRELSGFFYDYKLAPPEDRVHQVERNLQLAAEFGAEPDRIDYGLLTSGVDEARIDDLLADSGVDRHRELVVINPYTTWSSKNWPAIRYSQLTHFLIDDYGVEIIFTGGPRDQQGINEILRGIDNPELAHNFAGLTGLRDLTVLYRRARLFIGGDTGPMHLAAAVNTSVLALMGPTDPRTHGPYGAGHTVIQQDLSCKNCWEQQCPKNNECMYKISVDRVREAADKYLRKENGG